MSVFPNPAYQNNQIDFHLEESGMVKISILNKNGELIRSVLNSRLEAGEHSQMIDLTDLEPGLYFYQIETPEGSTSKKILVE